MFEWELALLQLLAKYFASKRGDFLFAAWNAETLVEAVNTSTGSNITLLASIERVALTAHVQVQIVTDGRADFDDVTARAVCSNFFIFWVNIFFHGKP